MGGGVGYGEKIVLAVGMGRESLTVETCSLKMMGMVFWPFFHVLVFNIRISGKFSGYRNG
jgi:hypothetical protein